MFFFSASSCSATTTVVTAAARGRGPTWRTWGRSTPQTSSCTARLMGGKYFNSFLCFGSEFLAILFSISLKKLECRTYYGCFCNVPQIFSTQIYMRTLFSLSFINFEQRFLSFSRASRAASPPSPCTCWATPWGGWWP